MPGKTIGAQFNRYPETVWKNSIEIGKLDGRYSVEYHLPKLPDRSSGQRCAKTLEQCD